MSTILPKIKTNRGNIGNDIWIYLPDLSSFEKTYLSADEASGQTVLSVLSGTNFSANEYIIIGTPGSERSEILKVSSANATTITTSSVTINDHNQGEQIVFIPFNQAEISSATSSGGSFSVLATVAIRADSLQTYYAATADAVTKYYKVRFKNENDTTYSDYSDEVGGVGFADNSVYSIKNRALSQLGEKIGDYITDEFLNDSLWEGRREIDHQMKKWSFRTSFNYDATNLVEGQYSFAVPSLLRMPDTPDNILGIRIGSGQNLSYINKRAFDNYYNDIGHTTVATQPAVGATSLVLATTRDLDDSGSVIIGANTITYTAKDNSTNTISGVPASGDGSIDATHAVGTDVWQHASFGEPTHYTIYEDTIFFNTPVSSDFEGFNVWMDFYRTIPEYNSDADIVDEPDPDCLVSFVKYKIKDKKEKGKLNISKDPDYQNYIIRRNKLVDNERINQNIRFIPAIDHLIDID